jgi:hypothetical protein
VLNNFLQSNLKDVNCNVTKTVSGSLEVMVSCLDGVEEKCGAFGLLEWTCFKERFFVQTLLMESNTKLL